MKTYSHVQLMAQPLPCWVLARRICTSPFTSLLHPLARAFFFIQWSEDSGAGKGKCLLLWLFPVFTASLVMAGVQCPPCSRRPSAGSRAGSCVSPPGSPEGSSVLKPLKRKIYLDLSFQIPYSCSWWSRHVLLFSYMVTSPLGCHSSMLVQAKLIPIMFTQVSRKSGVLFTHISALLSVSLQLSYFPYSHKHIGRWESLLCRHMPNQKIRYQSQLLQASLSSTNKALGNSTFDFMRGKLNIAKKSRKKPQHPLLDLHILIQI